MNRIIKAKNEAIKALKSLKSLGQNTNQKNAVDDLIAQTELVCDGMNNDPRFFVAMKGDDQAAFAAIEEEAGL